MVKNRLAKLISVKSIITIAMTAIMTALLLGEFEPPQELLSLYCTSYGAVMTYYFTRKDDTEDNMEDNMEDSENDGE